MKIKNKVLKEIEIENIAAGLEHIIGCNEEVILVSDHTILDTVVNGAIV